MIKTKITVSFYQNILTNAFDKDSLDDIRLHEIDKSQKEIRNRWANVLVRYENVHIPYYIRCCFKIKLTSKDEMVELGKNLLEISNMNLIYTKQDDTARKECSKRNKIIEHILKICTLLSNKID